MTDDDEMDGLTEKEVHNTSHPLELFDRRLKTVCVVGACLCLGLCTGYIGPCIPAFEIQTVASMGDMSWVFIGRGAGVFIGSFIGKVTSSNICWTVTALFLLFVGTVVVPWSKHLALLAGMFILQGLSSGVIQTKCATATPGRLFEVNNMEVVTNMAFGIGATALPVVFSLVYIDQPVTNVMMAPQGINEPQQLSSFVNSTKVRRSRRGVDVSASTFVTANNITSPLMTPAGTEFVPLNTSDPHYSSLNVSTTAPITPLATVKATKPAHAADQPLDKSSKVADGSKFRDDIRSQLGSNPSAEEPESGGVQTGQSSNADVNAASANDSSGVNLAPTSTSVSVQSIVDLSKPTTSTPLSMGTNVTIPSIENNSTMAFSSHVNVSSHQPTTVSNFSSSRQTTPPFSVTQLSSATSPSSMAAKLNLTSAVNSSSSSSASAATNSGQTKSRDVMTNTNTSAEIHGFVSPLTNTPTTSIDDVKLTVNSSSSSSSSSASAATNSGQTTSRDVMSNTNTSAEIHGIVSPLTNTPTTSIDDVKLTSFPNDFERTSSTTSSKDVDTTPVSVKTTKTTVSNNLSTASRGVIEEATADDSSPFQPVPGQSSNSTHDLEETNNAGISQRADVAENATKAPLALVPLKGESSASAVYYVCVVIAVAAVLTAQLFVVSCAVSSRRKRLRSVVASSSGNGRNLRLYECSGGGGSKRLPCTVFIAIATLHFFHSGAESSFTYLGPSFVGLRFNWTQSHAAIFIISFWIPFTFARIFNSFRKIRAWVALFVGLLVSFIALATIVVADTQHFAMILGWHPRGMMTSLVWICSAVFGFGSALVLPSVERFVTPGRGLRVAVIIGSSLGELVIPSVTAVLSVTYGPDWIINTTFAAASGGLAICLLLWFMTPVGLTSSLHTPVTSCDKSIETAFGEPSTYTNDVESIATDTNEEEDAELLNNNSAGDNRSTVNNSQLSSLQSLIKTIGVVKGD